MLIRTLLHLLVVAASVSASVAGSQSVVSKHHTSTPAAADVLNESFNNATDYDANHDADGDWAATTSGSGTKTVDPNETTFCAALTGFGTGFASECLESTTTVANGKAFTINSLTALHDDAVYVTNYFAIHGMGAWADGATQVITEGRSLFCGPTSTTVPCLTNAECTTGGDTCQTAVSPSVGSAAFAAQLVYDADGFTTGRDTCGGGTPRACWRLDMRIGGVGSTASNGLPEVLADQVYKLHFLVDKGSSTGEATFTIAGGSPVTIVSAQDSAFTLGYVRLGQAEFSLAAETLLYDGVRLSTSGYVDTP